MNFREWLLTEARVSKKLYDTFGDYKVYIVNGYKIRNASKQLQEFGGSNNHYFFPEIPEHEIWIEDSISKAEIPYIISAELYTIRKIENGMEKWKAYELGQKQSKSERDAQKLSRKHPERTDKPADKKVYIKKYGHIKDEDIEVWLVNGKAVRDRYKTDFIEGGHGYVYPWVPNNEIWLEDGPHIDKEGPVILLHEFLERTLMKYKKMSYDKAHDIAAKNEFPERHKLTKQKALALTKEKVLRMV